MDVCVYSPPVVCVWGKHPGRERGGFRPKLHWLLSPEMPIELAHREPPPCACLWLLSIREVLVRTIICFFGYAEEGGMSL